MDAYTLCYDYYFLHKFYISSTSTSVISSSFDHGVVALVIALSILLTTLG
jgi:hypothetical protein